MQTPVVVSQTLPSAQSASLAHFGMHSPLSPSQTSPAWHEAAVQACPTRAGSSPVLGAQYPPSQQYSPARQSPSASHFLAQPMVVQTASAPQSASLVQAGR